MIRGHGWAFSQRDFVGLGSRDAVYKALLRLQGKGAIRPVIRGLHDYPRFSTLLDRELSQREELHQARAHKNYADSLFETGKLGKVFASPDFQEHLNRAYE